MRKIIMGGEGNGFEPGDPARAVLGPEEEKPARVHAPLPPVKRTVTARTILADVKMRRQELEPLVEEYQRLEEGDRAITAALAKLGKRAR